MRKREAENKKTERKQVEREAENKRTERKEVERERGATNGSFASRTLQLSSVPGEA